MTVKTSGSLKKAQRVYKAGRNCAICGVKKRNKNQMTVDHIIPRAFYGDGFDQRNWQVLCESCHHKKTTRETYILSNQTKLISENDFYFYAGLREFADKCWEVRKKLGRTKDHIPLSHADFEKAGVRFVE